jgi:carboxymethylenebutenolidase
MVRKTVADFDPQVLLLFDAYVHGALDRRGFLDKAAKYAVGGVTASMLLEQLNPKFAEAQVVAKDDPRLKAEYVEFASPQGYGKVKGYLVRPAKSAGQRLPGVLVIHENRGLNPHIEDIARRVALDNFVAFAPDALTPLGGYPAAGEDEARTLFQKLEQPKTREDMVAAAGFLRTHAECTGRIGAVGFCYGGGVCNFLATRVPQLLAAVPFYGGPAATEDVPKIKAQLLIHYAGTDERINAAWPAYETALKAAGVKYTMHMYPGTQHGFNNDTTPRYDKAAAAEAWTRTIAFFNTTLRS